MQNNYTAAQAALNSLPQNTISEQNFVTIQNINLDRLSSSEDYILSPEDEATLTEIGNSYSDTRSSARGLLAFLKNKRLPLLLPEERETIQARSSASSNEMPKNNQFNIYPNPSSDIVNIVTPTLKEGNYTLSILDLNGKLISRKSLNSNNKPNPIDVSQLHSGIYIIRIDLSGAIVHQQKTVIIK